ncbi:c-type cytochrome biogenesis protein CcmI [Parvibaculum sedimenti]|uniref:C-type cytochrome biogenesis protein CcmI n=1 Tax=Parvibaculum sedimenti TaxID=2608632 RepID=A0A6N6VPX2_9HYPH|nr:c-type cytochrome biogenesis protein CcmI [Parvibaculum sedimenti]KAB7741574.1 c-type cytochrome biogenesis protein CcmI [Parvibaculum sedimenti]
MSQTLSDLPLWFLFAVLTAGVILAVLRPLRRKRVAGGDDREVTLYRDQLAEVERDVERGVIEPAEAEAAKVEVSRRLLAAAEALEKERAEAGGRKGLSGRGVALAISIAVPVFSMALYLALGSPGLPDQPFNARMAAPVEQLPIDALVLRVEEHLKADPKDLRGWEVLAPAYIRQRRYDDAANAWSQAIALGGESAARLAARGEARVFAAGGLAPEAREDFRKAAALDPHEPRAQYYLGVAEVEDGKKDAAIARWKALLASAPGNASWRPSLEAELARLENPNAPRANATMSNAPGPNAAQLGAAANMSPEDRQKMIEGMVGGLAARLEKSPDDIEGWLRLIRAYGVLGKKPEAQAALAQARRTFTSDKAALARLDEAEKALP